MSFFLENTIRRSGDETAALTEVRLGSVTLVRSSNSARGEGEQEPQPQVCSVFVAAASHVPEERFGFCASSCFFFLAGE